MTLLTQLSTALADRYAVEREIGAGGMATVYLARDLKHDRLVAVKVLNPELGALLGVERFLAEIRVTASLQHPNLLVTGDRDFERERQRLDALIQRFCEGNEAACTSYPHTFFGPMTPREWAVLQYKHLDHHLRQFGA